MRYGQNLFSAKSHLMARHTCAYMGNMQALKRSAAQMTNKQPTIKITNPTYAGKTLEQINAERSADHPEFDFLFGPPWTWADIETFERAYCKDDEFEAVQIAGVSDGD